MSRELDRDDIDRDQEPAPEGQTPLSTVAVEELHRPPSASANNSGLPTRPEQRAVRNHAGTGKFPSVIAS